MFEERPLHEMIKKQMLQNGASLESLQPIETTYIPNEGNDTPYIAATMLFAILAYPNKSEYYRRDLLTQAINAWRCKMAIEQGYIEKDNVAPALRSLPNQQITGKISRAGARIEKNLKFAQINGLVSLSEHMTNSSPVTFTSLVESKADHSDSMRRQLMRDWKKCKPVLHLIKSFWAELPEIGDISNPPDLIWSIFDSLQRANTWSKRAITNAENNRLFLASRTTIKPNEQISLIYPIVP